MVGKGNISEYRSKLDKTLASPKLKNYEMIRTLVKNQMLKSLDHGSEECTENVVEKRSKEMFDFLGVLRSASATEVERLKSNEELQRSWKVKEDTDEFRVMYREGTAGTPFHSLLVEGFVDGTLDVCVCVSCESGLYKKWWPQSAIPTFKILSSQCVKKVRMGEQISLVRMKLSWPLSSREALVHFFTLEYFQEGLIVVLLNTISDLESIGKDTHGFTRDGIPDAEDVVRIDVVGGFAMQKLTANRSYFRTIATMDIKLDFVPPAFINFISRQLVGSGFKLYKKEIASVTKGDEKFREALKDPMYAHIQEYFYSQNKPLTPPPLESPRSTPLDLATKDVGAHDRKLVSEIEELEEREEDTHTSCDIITNNEIIEEAESREMEVVITSNKAEQDFRTTNDATEHFGRDVEDKVGGISPEVRLALGTLEKAISMFRGTNNNPGGGRSGLIKNGPFRDSYEENGGELISSEVDRTIVPSKIGMIEASSREPKIDSNNHGSRTSDLKRERVITRRNSKKPRFCCFVANKESQG